MRRLTAITVMALGNILLTALMGLIMAHANSAQADVSAVDSVLSNLMRQFALGGLVGLIVVTSWGLFLWRLFQK